MVKNIVMALSVAAFVIPASGNVEAAASSESCPLSTVAWSADATQKFMYLICTNNTVHIAYQTGSNCPNLPIDTLKIWHSTALAAKLAQKPVTIWYTMVTCAGSSPKRVINTVEF
jgi:hypothetical protein